MEMSNFEPAVDTTTDGQQGDGGEGAPADQQLPDSDPDTSPSWWDTVLGKLQGVKDWAEGVKDWASGLFAAEKDNHPSSR